MRRLVGVIGLLVALALTAATADAATDSVRHQWSNVAEGCGDVIDMQGTMHGVFTITETRAAASSWPSTPTRRG